MNKYIKYGVVDLLRHESFDKYFDSFSEAWNYGQFVWNGLSDYDKSRRVAFMVVGIEHYDEDDPYSSDYDTLWDWCHPTEAVVKLYDYLDLDKDLFMDDYCNDYLTLHEINGKWLLWYLDSNIEGAIYIDNYKLLTEEELKELC